MSIETDFGTGISFSDWCAITPGAPETFSELVKMSQTQGCFFVRSGETGDIRAIILPPGHDVVAGDEHDQFGIMNGKVCVKIPADGTVIFSDDETGMVIKSDDQIGTTSLKSFDCTSH